MKIRRIHIERFRCIEDVTWQPAPDVNVLIGSGDVGKTTILEAIELALLPQANQAADETDYFGLDVEAGFSITLTIGGLTDEAKASMYPIPLWGWKADDDELAKRPKDDYEDVIQVCTRGTADLELIHELLCPGASPRTLFVSQRAALGMWSVGVGRDPESELRMRRGALLERVLGSAKLRGNTVDALKGITGALSLPDESQAALDQIATNLKQAGVPTDGLGLGVVSVRGQSPVATLGLTVRRPSQERMPFGSFGRGTKQLAMVALAAAQTTHGAIAIADELETGLEPYRQRQLFQMLRSVIRDTGQAFITTHSPTVLEHARGQEVWRIVDNGALRLISLSEKESSRLLAAEPASFFSRLIVVCEGVTEVGLLGWFLRQRADDEGIDWDALGVHLADGNGYEPAMDLLTELHDSGHPTIGFVDNETFKEVKRETLRQKGILCTFSNSVNTEEAVVHAFPNVEDLDDLMELEGRKGDSRESDRRRQQIGDAVGKNGNRAPSALIDEGYPPKKVKDAIASKAHERDWFKSKEAAERLADFVASRIERDVQFHHDIDALWEKVKEYLP